MVPVLILSRACRGESLRRGLLLVAIAVFAVLMLIGATAAAQADDDDVVRPGRHPTAARAIVAGAEIDSDDRVGDLDGDGRTDRLLHVMPGENGGPMTPVYVAALDVGGRWCSTVVAREPVSVNHNGTLGNAIVLAGRTLLPWIVEHHTAMDRGTGFDLIAVLGCRRTLSVYGGGLRRGTPTFRVTPAGVLEVLDGRRVVVRLRWAANGSRLVRAT